MTELDKAELAVLKKEVKDLEEAVKELKDVVLALRDDHAKIKGGWWVLLFIMGALGSLLFWAYDHVNLTWK